MTSILPFKAYFLKSLLFLMMVCVPVFGSMHEMIIDYLLVPSPVEIYNDAPLICYYDLGDETLYSVKFYKDNIEFYRYEPNNYPAVMTFPTTGVDVDESKSGDGSVYLRNLTLNSSGNYTCEVSTNAPYFNTQSMTKHLEVKGHVRKMEMKDFHVPSPVKIGDSALLRCDYDLGDKPLAILTFYKDVREFYRYVPTDYPQMKTFNLPGVDVDNSKSGKGYVYLRNLTLESSGNYTCEVFTEQPVNFDDLTKELVVVDAPVLMEEKSDYELGDNVSIRCNSGKSKPAPDIKWYINNQLAKSHLYDDQTILHPDSLESASLALSFRLNSNLLQNGKVTVKCVATVKHISAETSIEITAAVSRN